MPIETMVYKRQDGQLILFSRRTSNEYQIDAMTIGAKIAEKGGEAIAEVYDTDQNPPKFMVSYAFKANKQELLEEGFDISHHTE